MMGNRTMTSSVSEGSIGLERPPLSSSSISMNPRAVRGESSTRWTRGHFGDWHSQKCCVWGASSLDLRSSSCAASTTMPPRGVPANTMSRTWRRNFDIWEAYRNNSITSMSSINRCRGADPPMRHQHQLHLVALHQRVGLEKTSCSSPSPNPHRLFIVIITEPTFTI